MVHLRGCLCTGEGMGARQGAARLGAGSATTAPQSTGKAS